MFDEIPTYQRFSIPREVLVYFVHHRKEYLLRTLYFVKHYCTGGKYGSDVAQVEFSQIAEHFNVSSQTIKNHISALSQLGFLKPRKGTKDIFYVYGHRQAINAVRRIQDTTAFTLGMGKNPDPKKYIQRFHSPYLSGYRFCTSVLSFDKSQFRTVIQGAIYTHNIKQQAYQQHKKTGAKNTASVPNNDGANTGRASGQISCDYAGHLIGRGKMSGSRLRKELQDLEVITLTNRSSYVGLFPNRIAFESAMQVYEGQTIVPIPRRKGGGVYGLLVECSLTELCMDQSLVSCYRIRAGKNKRTDRLTGEGERKGVDSFYGASPKPHQSGHSEGINFL